MTLPPNVTLMTEDLLVADGFYSIGGDQIQVFPFTITSMGQLRVPVQQTPGRQSFSIRCWVGDNILGNEVVSQFHPGFGGLSHLFYDPSITPTTMDIPPMYNSLSGQYFKPGDILQPLAPSTYYYHVHNLERSDNGYKIGFVSLSSSTSPDDPCAIFN